ncbi:MAG: sugar-binding domain-containing protein [Mangrovibacterium sp.]
MKLKYKILILFTWISCVVQGQVIDLSGTWQVKLDAQNELIKEFPTQCKAEGTIELPASLAEKGYGFKSKGSDFGVLTPAYKYVGKAWYSREIEIPKAWKNKSVEILLERVLWESRIFIDGEELSRQDALGTAHVHQLGKLSVGKHQLTVLVDNEMIHNIGDKGHAYGEYTQSIWNGIVGRMEMKAYDPVRFNSVSTYPNLEKGELNLKMSLQSPKSTKARIEYEVRSVKSGEVKLLGSSTEKLSSADSKLEISIPVNHALTPWTEFNPEVYALKMTVKAGKYQDVYDTEFGYYEVSHDGTKTLINGKPVFLRGNLDCVHFPKTGYASCKVEDWERIFRIYKDYGLNHARFHSWCPPEAAFIAADRIGIYLQAEASIWIDWWMSIDNTERNRPEMNTKGFPKGLGHNAARDSFVVAEMNRVVDFYGNHPSFTHFCIGNELGNSDFEVMKEWVADLKKKDPRHLYAVSTARTITEVDDYSATHYIKGVGRTRGLNGAHTDWDFEENYSQMNIPIIAHEIGQWPVYPMWSEIEKYSGVLKARNFEEFKAQAEKNGIGKQDVDFARASGALNQIMYKYETESFFRTASCAGIQLLSMQDYQGQGEALIGWLDAFWESKNITTPEKFREHFNTTVPLLRMSKFVWTSEETFTAKAQVSHHGAQSLQAECVWNIANEAGEILENGSFGKKNFALGSLNDLGEIKLDLKAMTKAQKLTVNIEVKGTEFRNQWDFWAYPAQPKEVKTDVLVVDRVDEQAIKALENGQKVLLIANELGTDATAVSAHFHPLYWSLTFFPGQGKTCIGLLLQDQHPAFADFPTAYHSDWQWESICAGAKGFLLNDMPEEYKPIAQPVDDFHRNNKVGSIFELAVGKGKLLVCGYNLNANQPVAKQLQTSLLEYMNSSEFTPTQSVDVDWLKAEFPFIPKAKKADVPEEFEGAILYVDAAANLDKENESLKWKPAYDEVKIATDVSYQLDADGVWKDAKGCAWQGKEMSLKITCPDGILGSFYVHLHDWNNLNRTGILDFEGRKVKLDRHKGDGQWVKFHVMREDSNDGQLILKTQALNGPNLMITKIVLVKEE